MIHTNNALTKNIQIPLWFLLIVSGYGLFEIYTLKRTEKKTKRKADSNYAALNRERAAALKRAQDYEQLLSDRGILSDDELWYD